MHCVCVCVAFKWVKSEQQFPGTFRNNNNNITQQAGHFGWNGLFGEVFWF